MSEISKLNGYDLKDKKAIRSYDTVALMVADETIKEGQHIKTKGYYSVNDGGMAYYNITDTEDQYKHQETLSNGLYATLIVEDHANILQFGAKGDGINDDSQYFIYAISNNKTIYIPEGTYLISNSIDLLSKDIEIYGTSNTLIISDSSDIFIKTTNIGYVNIHDLTFNVSNEYSAIKYDSTVDIQTSTNSIRINNCRFFGISKDSLSTAIYLDGVYNPIISDCFFNKINAIYQELSINASINNCTFRECNYAINFNGIGATASSCGNKIVGCDFTECNVGVKAITTDWIDISSCIIDYCLYPIILLGQEYGTITNTYMSAKNGNPVLYINKDLTNENIYLNGNDSNNTSKSIVVSNCFISNNLEIDYSTSNPNLSADNIIVTCSWFTMNDCTVDNYSRNGINLINCNNVIIKHTRFNKTIKYTPLNDVYSIYGTTNNDNVNYDLANFNFLGIITSDTISRYYANINMTKTNVLVDEKYGYAVITAGTTSVNINTGLHNPIKNIQLTTSANTKVFYSNVSQDGTSFTVNISDSFEYPVQVSWLVKG